MPVDQRKTMIDEQDDVSVMKQCQMVDVNRSTYYYKPQEVNSSDLTIRRVDKL